MNSLSPSEGEMLKLLLLLKTITDKFMKQESQSMFRQRTFALCFIDSKQHTGIIFYCNYNFYRFCFVNINSKAYNDEFSHG